MLVLSRKAKERIEIGNDITVTVVKIKGNAVRVGIEAPDDVHIRRGELGRSGSMPSDRAGFDTVPAHWQREWPRPVLEVVDPVC